MMDDTFKQLKAIWNLDLQELIFYDHFDSISIHNKRQTETLRAN